MDRLLKTNSYKYDDPFGNEHTYLFSHRGVDIYPDKLSPNLETCQESMTMTSAHDDNHSKTPNNPSNENTHNNKSILSMNHLIILHASNILPQNSKDDFKAYTHCPSIPTNQYTPHIPESQQCILPRDGWAITARGGCDGCCGRVGRGGKGQAGRADRGGQTLPAQTLA
jgi:hypothetical protein